MAELNNKDPFFDLPSSPQVVGTVNTADPFFDLPSNKDLIPTKEPLDIGFLEGFKQAFAHTSSRMPTAAALKLVGLPLTIPPDVPGLITGSSKEATFATRAGATAGNIAAMVSDFLPWVTGLGFTKFILPLTKIPTIAKMASAGAGAAVGYLAADTYTTENRLPTTGEALFAGTVGAVLGAAAPAARIFSTREIRQSANKLIDELNKTTGEFSPRFAGTKTTLEPLGREITMKDVVTLSKSAILGKDLVESITDPVRKQAVKTIYDDFINNVVTRNPLLKAIYNHADDFKNFELLDSLITKNNIFVDPITALEFSKAPANPFPSLWERITRPFDPARMAERFDGGFAGAATKEIIKPIEKMYNFIIEEQLNINTTLGKSASASIKENLKNNIDTVVQYMSGKIDRTTAVQKGVSTDAMNWLYQAETLSNKYLEKLNQTRKELGLAEIPARKHYMPHIFYKDFSEAFNASYGLGTVFERAESKGDIFKSWMTTRTKEIPDTSKLMNPVDAFMSHINSLIDTEARLRTIPHIQARVNFMPAGYREWFTTFLNREMGEKPAIEQWINKVGAGKVLDTLHRISTFATTNVIAANMRIAVQQFSQILPTIAGVGFKNWLKGTYAQFSRDEVKSILSKSSFIQGRLAKQIDADIQRGWYKNFTEFSTTIMRALDRTMVENTYLAAYKAALDHGASQQAAIKAADIATRKIQAAYYPIYRPLFLNNKLGKTLMPLSTFMFNQWNLLMNSNDTKFFAMLNNRSMSQQFAQMLASVWLTNLMYETVLQIENPHPMMVEAFKGVGVPAQPFINVSARGVPGLIPNVIQRTAGLVSDGTFFKMWHDDPDVRSNAFWRILNTAAIIAPAAPQLVRTIESYERIDDANLITLGRGQIRQLTPAQKYLALVLGWRYVSPMKDVQEYRKLRRIGFSASDIYKLKETFNEEDLND